MSFITLRRNPILHGLRIPQSRIFIRLCYFVCLMRLHRPIGIFLLLWPTLWALWIASHGIPPFKTLFLFISGVILMRSAGCVINDLADRDFDQYVKRTQDRPLVKKNVSVFEAQILFIILIAMAGWIVFQFNWLTIKLAALGLGFTIIYPFMKRITHLPQLFLGVAFAWGIPMAFAAVQNQVPNVAWILLMGTLFWVIAYDTLYAMVDREDDIKAGIQSTAILFGRYDKIIIGMLQSIFLLLIFIDGWLLQMPIRFFIFLAAAGLLIIHQQILIDNRQSQYCFKAFLNNHWVGLLIFMGVYFAQ